MRRHLEEIITRVTGSSPVRSQPMGGGCVGDVRRVTLEDGRAVVAKTGDKGSGLDLEGFMLRYLRDTGGLPVPDVLFADDGPGVPQELGDHIFEPFFSTKEAGRASGLGLAIAREIARSHGGGLELSSAERGAAFELRLPLP